jgi:O-antigen ligase
MFGIPETILYPVLAILALIVALTSPLHWLVLLDLGVVGSADLHVAGARIDSSDIVFVAVVLGLLLRSPRSLFPQGLPNLSLWLALGTVLSASYLVAPVNQHQLEQPLSIAYQVYRYCWQPILPFLLGALLLASAERARQLMLTLTLLGGAFGLVGMLHGLSGGRAGGPYGMGRGNTLGGWLIVSIACAITLLALAGGQRRKLLVTVALALMLGALVYSNSRGAFVGFVVGLAFFSGMLLSKKGGRHRLARLMLVAAGLFLVASLLRPGLLQRGHVQNFMELAEGTEVSTFEWRMEHRWPHFFALAREHPWLGTGTYVDPTLSRRANTPHNGYLAVAVRSGFPAAALYLLFGLLAVGNGVRLFRNHPDPDLALTALGLATAVVCVLVHNFGESTLVTPREVGRMFFLATGVLAGLRAAWGEEAIAVRRSSKDRVDEAALPPLQREPRTDAGP